MRQCGLERDLQCGLLKLARSRYPSERARSISIHPPPAREHMNQSNETNESNDNSSQEQQPISMAMRFRKAFLMAAVMVVIGWAIGVV